MSEDCHDVIDFIASQVPEDIDKSHGEFIPPDSSGHYNNFSYPNLPSGVGYGVQGTGTVNSDGSHQIVEDFQFFSVSVLPSTQTGNTNQTFSVPTSPYSSPYNVNPTSYPASPYTGPAVIEEPEPVEKPGRISEMNRLIGENRGRKLDI